MPANQACVTEMSKMIRPEEAEITENTKSHIWGVIPGTVRQMLIGYTNLQIVSVLFFLRIESHPSCLWKCVESIQCINHRSQWLFNYVKLIKRLRRFSKYKVILYLIAPSSGDKVISFQLLTWPDPDTDLWLAAALFEPTRYWPMIGWNSVPHVQLCSWTTYKLGTMLW